ncbi:hypothetical protein ASZ78_009369, partial [Callipepla squamata]
MAVVLIFVPQPSVSLHPSYGAAVGDNVTVRCHVPRVATWIQLWLNGMLIHNIKNDEERDAVEFSFPFVSLKDAGTYQCRYQVSEPLWTSNRSDPVELVVE